MYISEFAQWFMSLFQAGGELFLKWVTGIIPMIICLMTAINAITKLIGEKKVERFMQKLTKYRLTRYTLVPILAVFFLGNPMCYSFGKFMQEDHKPSYFDACVSFLHPITGLFPHANPGELFVFMGIATGITQLGLPIENLAIRYFIVGVMIIFLRGIITEKIYLYLKSKSVKEKQTEDISCIEE